MHRDLGFEGRIVVALGSFSPCHAAQCTSYTYIYASYSQTHSSGRTQLQEVIDSLLDVRLSAPFTSCTLPRLLRAISYLHVVVLGRGFRAHKYVRTVLQYVR